DNDAIWRNLNICRKTEGDAINLPGICRVRWIIERNRAPANILELDELVRIDRRLKLNFLDYDRPNPRSRIDRAQRDCSLGRVKNFADAVRVTAEGNAQFCRTKLKALAIASECSIQSGRREVNRIAARVQAETRIDTRSLVEIGFTKSQIPTARD